MSDLELVSFPCSYSTAVQFAKARGTYVIAITITGPSKVDVVIDLVAGKQWPVLLNVLKPKGRYAVSSAIGGPLVELDIRTLYSKDLSFFGVLS